ncbi:MAG: LptF/LptG family permease [Fibrobacteres bacterium]|nr:LptF/LptG family permease [Fibrobacterota bacterium]
MPFLSILRRYILMRFIKNLALSAAAILFIYIIIDYVGQLRRFTDIPMSVVAVYYFAKIPYILNLIISIILLITTMLTIGGLAKTSEITAMRASGVSLAAISMPILLFSLLLTGLNIVLNETLLPKANMKKEKLYKELIRKQPAQQPAVRTDFIYRGYNDVIFRFKSHYDSERMRGESVDIEFFKDGKLYRKVSCASFSWNGKEWVAVDAVVRSFESDGVQSEKFKEFKDFPVAIKEQPDDILRPKKNSEEMGFFELREYIDILKRAGESPYRIAKFVTDLHVKVAMPFIIFVVALFGVALTVRTGKRGMARNFGIGLFIGFLYYFSVNLGIGMGQGGTINPMLGAWLGSIIFAPVGMLYFLKVARYE